jgi:hypothetical protein
MRLRARLRQARPHPRRADIVGEVAQPVAIGWLCGVACPRWSNANARIRSGNTPVSWSKRARSPKRTWTRVADRSWFAAG